MKQKKDGIFISLDKYIAEILKKFSFTEVGTASIPMKTQKPLLKDEDGEDVDVHMYRYLKSQPKLGLWYSKDSLFDLVSYIASDYVEASLDRKPTTGGITYYCWLKVNAARHNLLLLDGKKIIITETYIIRGLQLAGEEGVDCLPNSTIFEQLALIGMIRNLDNVSGKFLMYPRVGKGFYGRVTPLFPTMVEDYKKGHSVPQPSDPMDHDVDETVHKELEDNLVRAATIASSLELEQDIRNINKTQSKATPNESGSQGTNSSGGPRCQETMKDTTAQTKFESVSKLSNDSLLARGNTHRSDEDRMKLNKLMALCTTLQNRVIELEKTKTTQKQEVVKDVNENVVEEVVNAAHDSTATTTITTEEITLAQALEALKISKPKVKGIVIHKQEELSKSTATIPKQQSQDKGKEIMIEKHMKPKKKDQIRLDEEAAKRVNTFEEFRPELVERNEKRAGKELIQESTKKQKVDDDKEKAELKQLMVTIPDEEKVAIDVIPLAVKSRIIVD
nr:hypothetical protein [Tanacetum cinerariifolium]